MERTGIAELISYWSSSVGAQIAPSVFYAQLESEIVAEAIEGVEITRTFWKEGGWFSARREYLRVRWKSFNFDICGFPMGSTFTVSWWMGTNKEYVRELLFEIPIFGKFVKERIYPATYFTVDVEASFQRKIHSSVLRVLDDLSEKERLPHMSETERQPILAEFYD